MILFPSGSRHPTAVLTTLIPSASIQHSIICPKWARRISVFNTHITSGPDVYVSVPGSTGINRDGQAFAVASTHAIPVPAGSQVSFLLTSGRPQDFYHASGSDIGYNVSPTASIVLYGESGSFASGASPWPVCFIASTGSAGSHRVTLVAESGEQS